MGEALSGGYAVAPARSHIRTAKGREDVEVKDEDEDEEGVYIHRTATRRRRRVSGVPGTGAVYHD